MSWPCWRFETPSPAREGGVTDRLPQGLLGAARPSALRSRISAYASTFESHLSRVSPHVVVPQIRALYWEVPFVDPSSRSSAALFAFRRSVRIMLKHPPREVAGNRFDHMSGSPASRALSRLYAGGRGTEAGQASSSRRHATLHPTCSPASWVPACYAGLRTTDSGSVPSVRACRRVPSCASPRRERSRSVESPACSFRSCLRVCGRAASRHQSLFAARASLRRRALTMARVELRPHLFPFGLLRPP